MKLEVNTSPLRKYGEIWNEHNSKETLKKIVWNVIKIEGNINPKKIWWNFK